MQTWFGVCAFRDGQVTSIAEDSTAGESIPDLVKINWPTYFLLEVWMYFEFDIGFVQKWSYVIKITTAYNNLAYMVANFKAWSFMRLNPIQRVIIINRSYVGFLIYHVNHSSKELPPSLIWLADCSINVGTLLSALTAAGVLVWNSKTV